MIRRSLSYLSAGRRLDLYNKKSMVCVRVKHSLLRTSLRLIVSSEGSRLNLIRVFVWFVHVRTCVVEQCGSMVAFCGRALMPGVRHKINLITYFWLHVIDGRSKT